MCCKRFYPCFGGWVLFFVFLICLFYIPFALFPGPFMQCAFLKAPKRLKGEISTFKNDISILKLSVSGFANFMPFSLSWGTYLDHTSS